MYVSWKIAVTVCWKCALHFSCKSAVSFSWEIKVNFSWKVELIFPQSSSEPFSENPPTLFQRSSVLGVRFCSTRRLPPDRGSRILLRHQPCQTTSPGFCDDTCLGSLADRPTSVWLAFPLSCAPALPAFHESSKVWLLGPFPVTRNCPWHGSASLLPPVPPTRPELLSMKIPRSGF